MKHTYKLLLTGFFTIGLYDALSSMMLKQFNLKYTYLAAVSFIIYSIFGFIGTKTINMKTGVIIAASIGLFDSTIGWEIALYLKADTIHTINYPNVVVWVLTAIFVTGLAAICGLIGSGMAYYFSRNRKK